MAEVRSRSKGSDGAAAEVEAWVKDMAGGVDRFTKDTGAELTTEVDNVAQDVTGETEGARHAAEGLMGEAARDVDEFSAETRSVAADIAANTERQLQLPGAGAPGS